MWDGIAPTLLHYPGLGTDKVTQRVDIIFIPELPDLSPPETFTSRSVNQGVD